MAEANESKQAFACRVYTSIKIIPHIGNGDVDP